MEVGPTFRGWNAPAPFRVSWHRKGEEAAGPACGTAPGPRLAGRAEKDSSRCSPGTLLERNGEAIDVLPMKYPKRQTTPTTAKPSSTYQDHQGLQGEDTAHARPQRLCAEVIPHQSTARLANRLANAGLEIDVMPPALPCCRTEQSSALTAWPYGCELRATVGGESHRPFRWTTTVA